MKFEVPLLENKQLLVEIKRGTNLVFIGANGTGKSRLGRFLEKSLFNKVSSSRDQNKNNLISKERDLSDTQHLLRRNIDKFNEVKSSDDNYFIVIANEYQQQKVLFEDKRIMTRIEFASFVIENHLSAKYNNNTIKSSLPPQNLSEIQGGTIEAGGITLDVDCLNVDKNNKESIAIYKNKLIKDCETIIEQLTKKERNLQKEIESLNLKIESFEKTSFDHCQRVTAHRSLEINESSNIVDLTVARNELMYGTPNNTNNTDSKWSGQEGRIQSDFNKLYNYLRSDESDKGTKYRQGIYSHRPKTHTDTIVSIWNEVLPQRTLQVDGTKIKVSTKDKANYSLQSMSEGERSIFYLLGQCICAEKNSLIIIDEPEIHIYSSLLIPLFSKIEQERSDCSFVYITHDLNFASSRNCSNKYNLVSYEHENKWEIEKLNESEVPEPILCSILGSRKNILFTEGVESSLDFIYDYVYRNLTVKRCSSCEEVKSFTRSFNKNNEYHRIKCFGLIDSDLLTEEKKEKLKEDEIYTLPVAILENIFLYPSVIRHLYRIFDDENNFTKETYLNEVLEWIENNNHWKKKILKLHLKNNFETIIDDEKAKYDNFSNAISEINLKELLNDEIKDADKNISAAIDSLRNNNNINLILSIHSVKDLFAKLSQKLGFTNVKNFTSKLKIKVRDDNALQSEIRRLLPKIGEESSIID